MRSLKMAARVSTETDTESELLGPDHRPIAPLQPCFAANASLIEQSLRSRTQ